jgi:putative cell wall-binding protein
MTATFTRIAGTDRTKTAAAITRAAADTSTAAVLVGSDASADALGAAFLAGRLKAPMLLTTAKTLSNAAATALTRLRVNTVHLIGGTSVISAGVEELLAFTYGTSHVVRHSGAERIATSLAVLAAGAAISKPTEAFVVRAYGSVNDGVAAGPIAYASGVPVLLVDGSVPAAWITAVKAAGITKVTVLGGTGAVPASVEASLKSAGFTIGTRIAGASSQDTAVAIAAAALSDHGFSTRTVDLARGDAPADALAAAPLAGTKKAPLLLTTSPTVLGAAATGYLSTHKTTLTTGTAFGGTGAISDAVLAAASAATGG